MKRLRTLATCWKTMSSINDHELCSSDDFKRWWWLSWSDDHGWPMNDEFSQYRWVMNDESSQHWWVMSDDFSQHWWAMSIQHKKFLKLPKTNVNVFLQQSQSSPQTFFFVNNLRKLGWFCAVSDLSFIQMMHQKIFAVIILSCEVVNYTYMCN